MNKSISWLLVVLGVVISILVGEVFYEIPEFIAGMVVGVGILGTMGYVNKKKY